MSFTKKRLSSKKEGKIEFFYSYLSDFGGCIRLALLLWLVNPELGRMAQGFGVHVKGVCRSKGRVGMVVCRGHFQGCHVLITEIININIRFLQRFCQKNRSEKVIFLPTFKRKAKKTNDKTV
jgi:hypothetical protein